MNNTVINKYIERVDVLIDTLPPLCDRGIQIELINEDYYKETGENLPSFLLEILGTWYLQETYSDNRSNKVALEEYPILTEHQLYRRGRKSVPVSDECTLDMISYHRQNNSSVAIDRSKNGQDWR